MGDDEIAYFARSRIGTKLVPISIKFGIRTLTRWLRSAATTYAARCATDSKLPADNFDASQDSLARLDRKWTVVK